MASETISDGNEMVMEHEPLVEAVDYKGQNRRRNAELREERKREEQRLYRQFALWLWLQRRRSGRTQATCALQAGMDESFWSRLEAAEVGPPYDKIEGIARAVRADPADAYDAASLLPPEDFAGTKLIPVAHLDSLTAAVERLEDRTGQIYDLLTTLLKNGEV